MPALTRSQRKNLAKLADYLESLPRRYRHFEMAVYCRGDNLDAINQYALKNGGVASCGAVACAVGHGPAAGILLKQSEIDSEEGPDWDAYYSRAFGEDIWWWAFSAEWRWFDRHHWGAAARIRYFLANKRTPEDFRYPSKHWKPLYREFDKRYAERVQ